MSVTVFLDADEITGEAYAVNLAGGRQLESDVFNPGGGTIFVRNQDANFNPYFLVSTDALLQGNGDYLLRANGDRILLGSGNGVGAGAYGEILTGRKVVVKDGAVTIFTGYVEDYDYTWTVDRRSEAILTVRDSLATLGATSLKAWVPDQQLTGARLVALLDRPEVAFPSGATYRDIATGTQPLMAGTSTTNADGSITYGPGCVTAETNGLTYAQLVNQTESGRLFASRAGKLTFQDRYAVFGLTPAATFADDGTGIPMSGIQVRFGTELLHFQVTTQRAGSDIEHTATATPTSPNLGARHLPLTGLLFNSEPHTKSLADFLLRRFSPTDAVFSGITVQLGRLSSVDRATVCGLDIGDVADLSWVPPGTSGAVSQTLAIEGWSYTARASKNKTSGATVDATMSFQLSDASDPDYFTFDTDSYDGPKVLAP